MIERTSTIANHSLYPIPFYQNQLPEPVGYFKEKGKTRPVTPQRGLTESEFSEGSKSPTGIGGPRREYSRAVPMSELAHTKSQFDYLKSLNERLKQIKAGGSARKAEKKSEKERRTAVADKNLALARAFFAQQEAIRKGRNPPPINIEIDVDDAKQTLPRTLTKEQKEIQQKQKEREERREEHVIKNVTQKPESQKPSSPAFVSGQPDTSQSGQHTEEPDKPKTKPKLSVSEYAAINYPVRG